MKDFLRFRNRIIIASALLAVSTAAVTAGFGLSAVAFGVLLGGAGSVAKLWLSSLQILKFARKNEIRGRVRSYMSGQMFRYGLVAGALAAGFFVEGVNFAACAAALFTTNVVIIGSEILMSIRPARLLPGLGKGRTRVGDE